MNSSLTPLSNEELNHICGGSGRGHVGMGSLAGRALKEVGRGAAWAAGEIIASNAGAAVKGAMTPKPAKHEPIQVLQRQPDGSAQWRNAPAPQPSGTQPKSSGRTTWA